MKDKGKILQIIRKRNKSQMKLHQFTWLCNRNFTWQARAVCVSQHCRKKRNIPRILYTAKEEGKTFSDKQKLKECIFTGLVLEQILRDGDFQTEKKIVKKEIPGSASLSC